ncbi:MAG: hypothetical protein Q7S92_02030 [Candidatus Diapherotrites archaeon]|nr:hypothetical protein [Candidatus Diapherotrites archaeon]
MFWLRLFFLVCLFQFFLSPVLAQTDSFSQTVPLTQYFVLDSNQSMLAMLPAVSQVSPLNSVQAIQFQVPIFVDSNTQFSKAVFSFSELPLNQKTPTALISLLPEQRSSLFFLILVLGLIIIVLFIKPGSKKKNLFAFFLIFCFLFSLNLTAQESVSELTLPLLKTDPELASVSNSDWSILLSNTQTTNFSFSFSNTIPSNSVIENLNLHFSARAEIQSVNNSAESASSEIVNAGENSNEIEDLTETIVETPSDSLTSSEEIVPSEETLVPVSDSVNEPALPAVESVDPVSEPVDSSNEPLTSSDANSPETILTSSSVSELQSNSNSVIFFADVDSEFISENLSAENVPLAFLSIDFWNGSAWVPVLDCQDLNIFSTIQDTVCDLSSVIPVLSSEPIVLGFRVTPLQENVTLFLTNTALKSLISSSNSGTAQITVYYKTTEGLQSLPDCVNLDFSFKTFSCDFSSFFKNSSGIQNLIFEIHTQQTSGSVQAGLNSAQLDFSYSSLNPNAVHLATLLSDRQPVLDFDSVLITGSEFTLDQNVFSVFSIVNPVLNSLQIKKSSLTAEPTQMSIQSLPVSIPAPEGIKWQNVFAVNFGDSNFSEAVFQIKDSNALIYFCSEFNFEKNICALDWIKLNTGKSVFIPSPGVLGFGIQDISFIHGFVCLNCDSKNSSAKDIQVNVKVFNAGSQTDVNLTSFFPVALEVIDSNQGLVLDHNSEFRKIVWQNLSFENSFTQSYVLRVSPKNSKKAFFFSMLSNLSSDYVQMNFSLSRKEKLVQKFEKKSMHEIRKDIQKEFKTIVKKHAFESDEAVLLPFKKSELDTVLSAQDFSEFTNSESTHFSEKRIGSKIVRAGFFGDTLLQPEIVVSDSDPNEFMLLAKPETNEFIPGEYKVWIAVEENNSVSYEEYSFSWGLITVNSFKPLYHPNEKVELYSVVLDSAGFPRSGAQIKFTVQTPSLVLNFSTVDGTIVETSVKGVYKAEFLAAEIGNYLVQAETNIEGSPIVSENNFGVREFFEFDIVREMPFTIDPRNGPFHTKITITPFIDNSISYQVKEVFSKSITPSNTSASISSTDTLQYLDWPSVSGPQTFEYDFDAPFFWPRLFEFGKIQIQYDSNKTFTEERAFDLAIDPTVSTTWYIVDTTDTQQGVDINEPKPDRHTNFASKGTPAPSLLAFGLAKGNAVASNGVRKVTGATATGDYNALVVTSPPLRGQFISGTWTMDIWGLQNNASADLTPNAYLRVWTAATDSAGDEICAKTADGAEWGNASSNRTLMTWTCSGNPVTFANKDKLVLEIVSAGLSPGSSSSYADINYGNTSSDSRITSPDTLRLYAELKQPVISIPSADNNSGTVTGVNMRVQATVGCTSVYYGDCGDVNARIQFCQTEGCTNFADMNFTDGGLRIVAGDQIVYEQDLVSGETSSAFAWEIQGFTAATYELRLRTDANFTDTNTSSGTDRTITISAPGGADLTFALAYPASGCTNGKGRTSAGNGACEKVYFETTDLSGNADENQVIPEGGNPFFVYDNQSTSSSDINFTLDLNAALPSSLWLKTSTISSGYAGSCTSNPDNNCVSITTVAQNIGKAIFSTGSQDLNVWLWADFFQSSVQTQDRNATSTSVSS